MISLPQPLSSQETVESANAIEFVSKFKSEYTFLYPMALLLFYWLHIILPNNSIVQFFLQSASLHTLWNPTPLLPKPYFLFASVKANPSQFYALSFLHSHMRLKLPFFFFCLLTKFIGNNFFVTCSFSTIIKSQQIAILNQPCSQVIFLFVISSVCIDTHFLPINFNLHFTCMFLHCSRFLFLKDLQYVSRLSSR